jgi:multicomponent Na+:H+ antiporter subunit B
MFGEKEPGMTFIVKTITRLTLAFILLYGIYITVHSHRSVGGGFAGGVIVALSFIHLVLAFGKEAVLKRLTPPRLRITAGLAAIFFLTLALSNNPKGIGWLGQSLALSIFDMLVVSCGLFAIFIALVVISKGEGDVE